jgi:hypothetical protein
LRHQPVGQGRYQSGYSCPVFAKVKEMSNSSDQQTAARQRAQNYFTQTEKRDALVKDELEKERAASAAKTAKLRALRLAKEAEEREAAALMPVSPPKKKAPVKRKRVTKA